jgi:hypothetical protein
MLVADTLTKLVEQAHGGQGWVVGFAPNFITVHKYSIIRQPHDLQGVRGGYAWNVILQSGMLSGVFAV